MSATLVTAADAGWYHDPSDSGSWRWWDGATWTSHVRPKEATASIAVVQPVVAQPVAAQPVMQPVMQPVDAQPVIPQPAQPIQPIAPVSLTPATPASEQEYWHSPAAEIVEIPGRSLTSHSSYSNMNPGSKPYHVQHEWGDVGSPQTPGIWLLAAMPLITFGLAVVLSTFAGVLQVTTGASLSVPNIVFSVASVVASWIFAGLDIKALGERGYRPPKIWWMLLLPPLAYFIARGKVVRREGQRAWPPELLYFLSIIVVLAIFVLSVAVVISMLGGIPGQLT